jgi:ribose transport system permease protein
MPRRARIRSEIGALGYRLAVVVVIGVALALLSESFLTVSNLLNVMRQASLVFLAAAGLTLVILAAGLDLSVGANIGLSACLAATAIVSTGSVAVGVLVGFACGATIGLVNGALVTLLRVPPFIATYGMLWILNGVTAWYMAGETIYGFPPRFRALGSGYLLGVPVPLYLTASTLIAGGIFTRYTTYGRELYAIGANAEAARLSGVPVRARLNLVYTLSGAMAGLAGLVYLARLNSAEADLGDPLMLPAIAAVLVGGTSLFGGVGSLSRTLVGAVTLTLVLNGLNLLAVNANWQPLVTGTIVILAAGIDAFARRRADART